ncbi:MAG: hypothetical protein ACQER9_04295 [Nanobdellota archaeon]
MVDLWLPENGKEFREKIDISRYSDGDIPISHFKETFNQLSVWPLFEEMDIVSDMLERPVSCHLKQKLQDLIDEDYIFLGGPNSGMFRNISTDEYCIRVIKPGDKTNLEECLDAIGTCYDKPEHDKEKIVDNFMRDIDLGGTLIYFLIKDNKPLVYNKLFYSISRNDEPIFYYDAIENGDPTTNSICQWVSDNRTEQFLFSVGSAVQIAKDLDILEIGMAERELEELAFEMGCPNHYLLKNDVKKVGYPVHKKNKGDVVYQARVFGVKNNKPKVLDLRKIQSGTRLIQDFQRNYETLQRNNFNPNSKKYDTRFLYLSLCNDAIQKMGTGTKDKRDLIQSEFDEVLANKDGHKVPYLDDSI